MMRMGRRGMLLGLSGAAAGSLLSPRAIAGDLNPPPGPPSPTGRTLQELADRSSRTDHGVANPCTPIESLSGTPTCLYAITSPGSYCLTRNLICPPGIDGIGIFSADVDVDLFGFHLFGDPGNAGGPPSRSAIACATENVCVYDGTAVGWTHGFHFGGASRFVLWDVASRNAAVGGFVGGTHGQMYDCDVYDCPGTAFLCVGTRSLYEENGTWNCATGFDCPGQGNLFLSNCATGSSVVAFQIGQGNAYGPIVQVSGAGDISALPGGSHPDSNLVY